MMMMIRRSSTSSSGGEGGVAVKPPAWLQGLMAETFFGACGVHPHRRKNEKNIFCLYCCISFCPHCLPSHRHPSHPLLQVRRYVYQDVIRLEDLEKLIDCNYIQPYTINSAKVIFLNQRTQSSSRSCSKGGGGGAAAAAAAAAASGGGNPCFTCDRILQDPFKFCSLSCKVDHMVYQGEDLSSILLLKLNTSRCSSGSDNKECHDDFGISQFEGLRVGVDGQITPINSILEVEDPDAAAVGSCNNNYQNKEGGNGCGGGGGGGGFSSSFPADVPAAGAAAFMMSAAAFSSRRKRAPHRSPLS